MIHVTNFHQQAVSPVQQHLVPPLGHDRPHQPGVVSVPFYEWNVLHRLSFVPLG